jgi:hypothetical protein
MGREQPSLVRSVILVQATDRTLAAYVMGRTDAVTLVEVARRVLTA